MSGLKRDTKIFTNFYALLDDKQKSIYENIVRERLMIYFAGMALGLGLGVYYFISAKTDDYRLCKFLMIIYVVKLVFYYVYPKSPLMLYSLTTKDQVDAWADIYTEMKNRWIKSLAVGFFAYISLTAALLK